ncbi:MAG: hypothetical protein GY820_29945 [Gammaproteobacteria bacterium]|nr:hypothetical protein [Gammaproteobacteria bacterium]
MTTRKFFNADQMAEYLELLSDEAIKVKEVRIMSDEAMSIKYEKEDDFIDPLANTSEVIAAFVTTWARLKLYEALEMLGERVYYYDTDRSA